MTDRHFNRIYEENMVEKYINKYIHRSKMDDEMKDDIKQELYLILLEAMDKDEYQEVTDKFSYLCGILKNQCFSSSSLINRKYFYVKDNYEDNYISINQLREKL